MSTLTVACCLHKASTATALSSPMTLPPSVLHEMLLNRSTNLIDATICTNELIWPNMA